MDKIDVVTGVNRLPSASKIGDAPAILRKRPLRLLTVGHSYVVALNRRLAAEIAKVSGGSWDVTVVAPTFVRAELRDIPLERGSDEPFTLEPVRAYANSRNHVLTYGWRLREILRRGWDLVHCYQEPYIVAGWQVARWTPAGVPFVFYTAQNLAKQYPPPFSWMEQYCVNRCAGWIACGESVAATLLPRGYDAKPHTVIGFGVDLDRFRPDPQGGLAVRRQLGWTEPGPPVVGFFGRLVPEKGIGLLMSALNEVKRPWRALFVGSGPLEARVRQWAAQKPECVRVVTAVVHSEMPHWINAMDLVCVPSQATPKWQEQFGRVLIEAFACERVVVAAATGEIPHVLADAGVLLPEKDIGAWAGAISALLEGGEQRHHLAATGLRRAHEHYSWRVITKQYLDFFPLVMR